MSKRMIKCDGANIDIWEFDDVLLDSVIERFSSIKEDLTKLGYKDIYVELRSEPYESPDSIAFCGSRPETKSERSIRLNNQRIIRNNKMAKKRKAKKGRKKEDSGIN